LLYLSQMNTRQSKQMFLLFGMVYAVLSALLLGITAFFAGSGSINNTYEVIYFATAIIVTFIFSYIMGSIAKENRGILATPFIAATILQIVYIVFQLIAKDIGLPLYNLGFLVLGGMLVVALSWRARRIIRP